ncbi:MAG TPA: tetratricopeptide repeat protein [Pyrinomonadaceae bacterium]|jgi:tetratricopeptide (TPR) repeat protein
MAFDKAKAIRAAEKYLAQNKITSAIQEYRRIVEHDPGDFNALNTLGDLYARVDKKQEALNCFKRVAEHYRQQGFALKAVAVYKKVTRFNPEDPEVAAALGALYEQQGLLVDARAQYMLVVEAYARMGQSREALEILGRIADLDPQNTSIRIRLAESYLAEGMHDLAAQAFIDAGERLLARGEHEAALDAFTKARAWRPHSHAALQGLINAHSALGTADEAAEALETAVAERPGDLEVRLMLVRAYLEAENGSGAESATQELVNRDSSAYGHFFDVARLHLQQGSVDEAVSATARIVERALTAHREDELLEILQEALARDPEQIEALRLLSRVYTWQRDDDNLRIVLENLAEAAETLGLVEEEKGALAQLVKLAPFEMRYRERLEALGGSVDDIGLSQDVEEDATEGQKSEQEVPTFESFMLSEETQAGAPTPSQSSSTGDANLEPPPVASDRSEFEWNTVEQPPSPPLHNDASASFADLNSEFTDSAGSSFSSYPDSNVAANAATDKPSPTAASQATDFNFGFGEHFASDATPTPPPTYATDAYTASILAQELEGVDFYLEQGYADIARDTLDMLERQYGAQPEIEARRGRLPGAAQETAPPPAESSFATSTTTESFESGNSFDTSATFDSNNSFEPSSTFEPREPPASPVSTPAPQAPPPPAAIDPGLAAIFDEFREAAEEDDSSQDGDFETHYNMGLAYKEMELLDQAIEEFQTAASRVAPRDGTARYLHCCNLLGHCFMSKGVPRAAAIWFKKGLDTPGHTEDEYQALRYDLGTAYEQMGDLKSAIDIFTEVYGIDVSYRGVTQKLRELQAQKANS